MKESVKKLQTILVEQGYDLGAYGINKDGIDGSAGKLTRDAAFHWAKKTTEALGLRHCHNNMVELRMSGEFTDRFSDLNLIISTNKCVAIIPWTTKAGRYWVNNPLTVGGITGTGVVKEGQMLDSYIFHDSGKRKWGNRGYFKQVKPINVYRDGNKDNTLDKDVVKVAPSWYGFQIHPMGKGYRIWNWSSGCRGCSKALWEQYILRYFKNGQVISPIILEI
jgi:hypothetical protein